MFTPPKLLRKAKHGRLNNGRVDPFEVDPCIRLARLGFHAKMIARDLGLTVGQVHTRIKGVVSLRDYRNGKTQVAASLLRENFLQR